MFGCSAQVVRAGALGPPERVEKDNMTVGEIEAYKYGYDNEDDRKDWG